MIDNIKLIKKDIVNEYLRASKLFSNMSNLSEAWGVIQEEIDELWEEIRKKKEERSYNRLYEESIQIAAMILRCLIDCYEFKKQQSVLVEDFLDNLMSDVFMEIKNCHEGYARIKSYMTLILVCKSYTDSRDLYIKLLNLMIYFITMVNNQYKK